MKIRQKRSKAKREQYQARGGGGDQSVVRRAKGRAARRPQEEGKLRAQAEQQADRMRREGIGLRPGS